MPNVVVVFVVVENSPCVDVGVGFLSRVVDEVVGYLVNGDVPRRVLKEDYDAYAG